MTSPARPTPWQYLTYCYGRTLPPTMHDWVRNDLAGPGAARRTVVRFSIPCALMLVPFLFIHASIDVLISMTLPIFIPFVYFSIALNKVYRRARLTRHHLDPELVDAARNIREAPERAAYHARYRSPEQ